MLISGLEETDPGAYPGLGAALEFLRRRDLAALPDGRYELAGGAFAMVQRYATLPVPESPRFELHRLYADVQFLAEGSEVIGWAPAASLEVSEPYDPEKDAEFGSVSGGWEPLRLGPGELAVLTPEDAHAPRLCDGRPAPVLKVVVKLPVPK